MDISICHKPLRWASNMYVVNCVTWVKQLYSVSFQIKITKKTCMALKEQFNRKCLRNMLQILNLNFPLNTLAYHNFETQELFTCLKYKMILALMWIKTVSLRASHPCFVFISFVQCLNNRFLLATMIFYDIEIYQQILM